MRCSWSAAHGWERDLESMGWQGRWGKVGRAKRLLEAPAPTLRWMRAAPHMACPLHPSVPLRRFPQLHGLDANLLDPSLNVALQERKLPMAEVRRWAGWRA